MLNAIYTNYKESLSGLSREVWIISMLMLINRSGLMVIPFLSIYLTEELEFSLIQAGQAGMWFGIGSLISSLLGGSLTDRFGYSNIMKLSLFLGGIFFWTLMFAQSFLSFCVLIFFTALFADLVRPAVMSSISYYSKESNRTRAISLLRMAINLGISIGPALGGIMVAYLGYKWLFIINGSSSILTFILFALLYKSMVVKNAPIDKELETKPSKNAYSDVNYLFLLFITPLHDSHQFCCCCYCRNCRYSCYYYLNYYYSYFSSYYYYYYYLFFIILSGALAPDVSLMV